VLHARQDDPGFETRNGIRYRRALRVHSNALGIWGICDLVEEKESSTGLQMTPVETKHGKPKSDVSDKVQLCAQALCLEEMFGVHIPQAFLFYAVTRRRLAVDLDDALRHTTKQFVQQLADMFRTRETPAPVFSSRCKRCSFVDVCKPECIAGKSASKYVNTFLRSS